MNTKSADWLSNSIKCHQNTLYRTAIAMLRNKSDAEDILQDVFLKLYEKQPDFESAEHEKAWLIRVCVNMCKNRLKHSSRQTAELLLEGVADVGEEHSRVLDSVLALPPKYRMAVHLYYYEGYNTSEISDITQQSESAVRKQLERARKQLKEEYL